MPAMSFPPVLDQSSLSSEAGSLVPEGEDTKQPPTSLPTRFPATFSLQAAYCISFFALLQQFTYVSSGPPESVEEEKWQVQDEEFDIEKEDDNSSELSLQKAQVCI